MDLVTVTEEAIRLLDREMKEPSTEQRGKRIAAILNSLEIQKDTAKRFGLGRSLRSPMRRAAAGEPANTEESRVEHLEDALRQLVFEAQFYAKTSTGERRDGLSDALEAARKLYMVPEPALEAGGEPASGDGKAAR